MTSLPQHYSWLVSPYSAKTRSYLMYKGIDFEDHSPSLRKLTWTIRRAVGRPIMPTVLLPDGTWLQDSSAIIDHFEQRFHAPTSTPPGTNQRLACALIDLFADEWLPMAALHFRWGVPENAAFAQAEFARNGMPWLPTRLGVRAIQPMAQRLQGYLPLLGVNETTIPGVSDTVKATLAAAEATLSVQKYLFGDRPCLADFSLFGPLWSHLYRDPGTTHMFSDSPHVVAWMERLRTGHHGEIGEFLPNDQVPTSLQPMFDCIIEDLLPWIRTLVDAIDGYCQEHPEALRVPRSLGEATFTIRGRSGQRKLVTFVQWKAQRACEAYRKAEGGAEWLASVGCVESSTAIPVIGHPFRLENYKAVLDKCGL